MATMLWPTQIPVCRKCTTDASYFFLGALAVLAILLAHLFNLGIDDTLQASSTPKLKLVTSLFHVPFIFLALYGAVDCLLRPYYFRDVGEHDHLNDHLDEMLAWLGAWLAYLPAWLGVWLAYLLAYSWWVARYMVWYMRHSIYRLKRCG